MLAARIQARHWACGTGVNADCKTCKRQAAKHDRDLARQDPKAEAHRRADEEPRGAWSVGQNLLGDRI